MMHSRSKILKEGRKKQQKSNYSKEVDMYMNNCDVVKQIQ
jgi:hypothetical protein